MVRDAVLVAAGAALLLKLLVASDIAAGRLAYGGNPRRTAVGNLGTAKRSPLCERKGPRLSGYA